MLLHSSDDEEGANVLDEGMYDDEKRMMELPYFFGAQTRDTPADVVDDDVIVKGRVTVVDDNEDGRRKAARIIAILVCSINYFLDESVVSSTTYLTFLQDYDIVFRPGQNYIFIFWGFRALGNIKNIKFGMKNIK